MIDKIELKLGDYVCCKTRDRAISKIGYIQQISEYFTYMIVIFSTGKSVINKKEATKIYYNGRRGIKSW